MQSVVSCCPQPVHGSSIGYHWEKCGSVLISFFYMFHNFYLCFWHYVVFILQYICSGTILSHWSEKPQTFTTSLYLLLVELLRRREKESFYLSVFGLLYTRTCITLLFNENVNFSKMTIVIRLCFSDLKPDLQREVVVLPIDRFKH